MGELYYRGDDAPKWNEKRGVYSGRIWHIDRDANGNAHRTWKRYSCKAKGKRAAYAEYRHWRSTVEAQAQDELKRNGDDAWNSVMVPSYVDDYIDLRESAKSIEPSTVSSYRTSAKHIRARFADTALPNLKSSDIEDWIADLSRSGLSSSTVGKAYRLLKMVLNDAMERGGIDRNPCNPVKPPKRVNQKQGKNALDARQRADLIDKLEKMERCPVVTAAYISLYTGLRQGEICGLKWRDLDLTNEVIWVKRSIGKGEGGAYIKLPKTDRRRDVSLPPTLVKLLKEWKTIQREQFNNSLATHTDDVFIIGDPLGFHGPDRLSKEWHTIAVTNGVVGIEGRIATFHDLRHTWATMYLSNGGDANTAASNLGHANPSMTLDVYASADPDAKKRSAAITEKCM